MATLSPSTPAIAELQNVAPASALRKELGFTDLVLASILLVVVPDFFGSAVKAGPAHVVLWLLAIALFFLPQALVVSYLNERMPMEGGLYEWARHAFGDAVGFLVALNLWMYVVLYVASIGLVTTNYAAYALGLNAEAVASHRGILLATSIAIISGLMLVAHLGLGVGKWVTNVGSALTVLIIVLLAALPFARTGGQVANGYHPLRLVVPPLTLFSFSVFSKMSLGALCGFEYAAIFAGESRNPRRHLTRAIWIAAPLIALLYIFGTSAILAYVSPDNIDVIGPIPQALRVALGGTRLGEVIVPVAIVFLLTNYLSSFSLNFAANTRLPMCAGWDHLLPQWFTRLHPRHRTPVKLHPFPGRYHAGGQYHRAGGSRHTRSVRTPAHLGLHLLRHCLPGSVRHTGTGGETVFAARPALDEGPRHIRLPNDPDVRSAFDFSDYSRGQPVGVFGKDSCGYLAGQSGRAVAVPETVKASVKERE